MLKALCAPHQIQQEPSSLVVSFERSRLSWSTREKHTRQLLEGLCRFSGRCIEEYWYNHRASHLQILDVGHIHQGEVHYVCFCTAGVWIGLSDVCGCDLGGCMRRQDWQVEHKIAVSRVGELGDCGE